MVRNQRAPSKLKKKEARASAARRKTKVDASRPRGEPVVGNDTPPPLRMTPRPDLTVPLVSLENVDWEDPHEPISPLMRWELFERNLQKKLAELGADLSRPRFEPRECRVSFLGDDGVSLVEARAQLLGTWIEPVTSSAELGGKGRLLMAWADPAFAEIGVARIESMGDMILVDRATARELILGTADASGAEFVFPLLAPHGEHYFGLRAVRAALAPVPQTPGSPVGTVLRGLGDLRRAISQRDEPTDVLRARFLNLGKNLVLQSETTYRDSEWASRVQRAGKFLMQLAGRLVPPTFSAIAAGRPADEWVNQSVAIDLANAVHLLENE